MRTCLVCFSLMVVILHAAPLTHRRREAGVSKHDCTVHVSIRSTSSQLFPATMEATLILDDGTNLELTLERNDNITNDVPVHVDDMKIDDHVHKQDKKVAYYTENTYCGSFVVMASKGGDLVEYSIEGIMYLTDQELIVQKDEDGLLRVKTTYSNAPSADSDDEQEDEDEVTEKNEDITYTEEHPFGKLNVTEKKDNNNNGRDRRSTPGETQFDVETIFVIDHTIYDYWMSILGNSVRAIDQITYIFKNYMNSMQLAYASIDETVHGIRIMPRLTGIEVLTTRAESSLTVNSITSTKVNPPTEPYDSVIGDMVAFFQNAATWKKDRGYTWDNPDHMMVFTLYDVQTVGTVGVATVGEVCRGYNSIGYRGGLSVVEDLGFASWAVMAHELGHNLGARHDGSNGCRAEAMNIMTPSSSALTSANVENAHSFSSCSINDMKQTLMGTCSGCTVKTCLLDNKYSSQVYRSTPQLLGETMSLDDQCRYANGKGYSFYDDGSDHCMVLKCSNKGYWTSSSLTAADGSPCGNDGNSWCMRGRCKPVTAIQYSTSQSSTYTCSDPPAGCSDSAGFSINFNDIPLRCSDIATDYPSLCWGYSSIRSGCPATCHRIVCDTEAESPCPAPKPSSSGGCVDNPNMLLNGVACPDFCANLISKKLLQLYKDGWDGTCKHCCQSCQCSTLVTTLTI